jgi:GNAT superfamily N-acetyltransferase
VASAEAGQQRCGIERAHRRDHAEGQPPAQQAVKLVDFGAQGVGISEDAAGAGQRDLPRLGDEHPPSGPAEQLHPELLLEPSHLLRDGGLCHVQFLRGEREAAVPGHGGEVAKLPKLHDRSIVDAYESPNDSVFDLWLCEADTEVVPVGASADLRTDIRPGDVGAIVAFQGREYADQYGLDSRFEAGVAQAVADFAIAFAEDPEAGRLWLAEDEHGLHGCIAITRETAERGRVRWFLVAREARAQGLGRQLLSEALAYARERFQSLELETFSELEAAAHLYRSAGFELVDSAPHNEWGREIQLQHYELRLG